MTNDFLDVVLESIYGCVTHEAQIETALACTARLVGAQCAILQVIPNLSSETAPWVGFNVTPRQVQLYQTLHYQMDEWRKRIARHSELASGLLLQGEDVIATDALRQTEFYQSVLKPMDALYMLSGVIFGTDQNAARPTIISFFRSHSQQTFEPQAKQELARVIPHWQRMLKLREADKHIYAGMRTYAHLFEQMQYGVIYCSREGKVAHSNAEGARILASNDGLGLIGGELNVDCSADRQQLLNYIRALDKETPLGRTFRIEKIRIHRKSGEPPYFAVLLPLPQNVSFSVCQQRAVAVLLVRQSQSRGCDDEPSLREHYCLSKAETRLVKALLDGLTLKQSADALHISQHTARSHLKMIFSKTNTHRQAELIQLLLREPV